MKYSIPPGVFDIIPNDKKDIWKNSHLWSFLEQTIRTLAQTYGFKEIRTPLFERSELFHHSVGETSDIVSKEMYTFLDKGGRSLSLRPEGTAPAMRAFIEHQLHREGPVQKLFYIAPMFRYERSQAGRYRQHHQFGAEVIGESSPEQDAELIVFLYRLYERLGLTNLTISLNSIGDTSTRLAFKEALKNYLTPHLTLLSEDSQRRFETNPLRILDSKDPKDQEFIAGAPSIFTFLNEEARLHFERLKSLLTSLKIPFQINPLLVRGLDYYNKTVFEVISNNLGAQNSLGGGGRYDNLLKLLGGPDLPAVGFGTGLERILLAMINQKVNLPEQDHPTIFLVAMGEQAKGFCFQLLDQLRNAAISSQMDFNTKKIGKSLQYADQLAATYVVVIGDQELESGEIEIKKMSSGEKIKIRTESLIRFLKNH